MTNRIKDDDSIEPLPFGEMVKIEDPMIIVHKVPSGDVRFVIDVTGLGDDLRYAGILMTDLIDHIAHAYRDHLGRDERDIREAIYRVMKDEERFKQKDPARGDPIGKVFKPRTN